MEIEALEAILMDEFKGSCFLHHIFIFSFSKFVFVKYLNLINLINSSGFLVPEIHSSESGLNTSNRCFQITISPQVNLFSHVLELEDRLSVPFLILNLISFRFSFISNRMMMQMSHLTHQVLIVLIVKAL